MTTLSRRSLLQMSAAAPLAAAAPHPISLGFMTYGMKTLPVAEALRTCADIGYDGVEIALMPGWASEPKLLSQTDRRDIHRMLGDLGLALPCVMEMLPIRNDPAVRATNLERMKVAAEMANVLSPAPKPAMIETIVGGKTETWEKDKGPICAELREWAEIGRAAGVVICFKPHAANSIHSPERALWTIREVGSPHLRIVYDYSHMMIEGFPLESSLKQLLPYTPYIHMKDGAGTPADHQYLLLGDSGKVDYTEYFRILRSQGYQGFTSVEVSAMIHRLPGYEPVPTARKCYARIAEAASKAGVARPARKQRPRA
jgi:sugar phosphate isomerase/epimerase